jgi:CRISPR-associated Csx2 family protein
MSRKVFISILGASFYGSCRYASGSFTSNETRFVQEATLEYIGAKNWTTQDTALIFLTKKARADNWNKSITERKNNKTLSNEPYTGLEQLLEDMKLPFVYKGIDIVDGKDEVEIWKIFSTIYEELEEGDTLYFDLTHSFRYLPMLLLVLGNYAKFLKKIKIVSISYGNYEAREDNVAPFVDLLPLVVLQEWTSAANEFINFGNVERLKQLTDKNVTPILKETQGEDQTAQNLKKLAKILSELSENIKTNRGKKIIAGIEKFETQQQDIIVPLNPLLAKIEEDIKYFNQTDVKNMLAAVKWCIDKNLIQEGFTLLQEGIITLFLKDKYEDEKKRNFVSGYLNQYKRGNFESTRFGLLITDIIELEKSLSGNIQIAEWAKIFSQISDIRNDINHAGIRQNPMNAADFKTKLESLYKETDNLIKKTFTSC